MTYAVHSPSVTILLDMLTYKRPAGSLTEQQFIDKFIVPTGAVPDEFGNYWIDTTPNPNVLFSSHTDTVHHSDGMQDVTVSAGTIRAVVERVPVERTAKELDKAMRRFTLDGVWPEPIFEKSTNCLGADCTTGVWLMLEMIASKVPGRYVFHREEETGGAGSSHVAKNEPHRLDGIKFAIALDRKGYHDIITHQWGGRCSSDAFANSLSRALGIPSMKPDPTGSFTDTANYTHLIPECTNLSVGYFNQHGPTEEQDLEFAVMLRDHLIAADWTALVEQRKVTDVDDFDYEDDYPRRKVKKSRKVVDQRLEDMEWFVENHADEVARWLVNAGFDADTLAEELDVEIW